MRPCAPVHVCVHVRVRMCLSVRMRVLNTHDGVHVHAYACSRRVHTHAGAKLRSLATKYHRHPWLLPAAAAAPATTAVAAAAVTANSGRYHMKPHHALLISWGYASTSPSLALPFLGAALPWRCPSLVWLSSTFPPFLALHCLTGRPHQQALLNPPCSLLPVLRT